MLRCLFWGGFSPYVCGGVQNGSTKKIQKVPKQFIVIFLDKACCNRESCKGNVFCHMTMNYERIRHIISTGVHANLPFELPKIITSNRKPCGLKKASLSTRWNGFWSGSRSVLNGFFTAWQSPFRGLKKEELSRMTDHTIGAMDIYGQTPSPGNTKSTRQCGTLQQNTVSCWLKTLWIFFQRYPK